MKTLIKLATLLTLSFTASQAMAMKSLDINNKHHMETLGKIYACELYYLDIGETRKSEIIAIMTSEEFDTDWNKVRNDHMINSMSSMLYQLQTNHKLVEGCNKVYRHILTQL